MQTVKEFLTRFKNSEALVPRQSFVHDTKSYLKIEAARLERKNKVKKLSYIFFSTAAVASFALWLTLLGGVQTIGNTSSSLMNQFVVPFVDSSGNDDEEPLIFVYHTHSTESYLPLLSGDKAPEAAFDDEINVTLVGDKLAATLEESGVPALHDNTNITAELQERELGYEDSYNVSREIVDTALKEHGEIKMIFDVHRDTQSRRNTTATVEGVEMAQILFIVSSSSQLYEENLAFATQLHDALEASHPGLSRGVFDPGGGPERSNPYNLDLHPQSTLIEIGGVHNTLEEVNRSVEVLADVITEFIQ
ncbi:MULTISPECIES: stage II sporulation protein P [Bacillaceae]|uniref:Stage II sporulation protein P n=1 Tax=Evansella alkalicola TaxID=745819 RepID=A0ABS6JNH3_9BACI|nr:MULTISPECIES: stage II sporulation protein P [Bacillaceae]MBU9720114.1 stage II sporulation protein P [Bacillus alkalicola]